MCVCPRIVRLWISGSVPVEIVFLAGTLPQMIRFTPVKTKMFLGSFCIAAPHFGQGEGQVQGQRRENVEIVYRPELCSVWSDIHTSKYTRH